MPIAPPPTSPTSPAPPPSGVGRTPSRRLAGLTALVLAAHWLLLQGVPKVLAAFQKESDTAPKTFTMRTIEAPAPSLLAPARLTPAKPAPAKPRVVTPNEPPAPLPPPAVAEPLSAAVEPAPQQGVAAATSAAQPDASQATAPSPSPPAPATAAAASAPEADPVTADATLPANAAAPAQPVYRFAFPEPVRMLYDVKGVVTFAYTGGAEMVWRHNGGNYTASLQITKFGFSLRNWTSKGTLSSQGIAPARFGDKGRSSEVAAHFQRDKGIVSFSNNAPDVPLQNGAQDHLSAFFQLSGMLAAEPGRFGPGTQVQFQAANAQGSQDWVFTVGETEAVELPDGPQSAIRLSREHSAQYDTKVEVWLAPALSYLPVRIRLSQTNGDFAELLWRSARKPE